MKRLLAALLVCLGCTGAVQAQDAKPDLLLYISPNEYSHEVRLGLVPYYIVWARRGPALEQAARRAFENQFASVGMCEGSNGADVVVWLHPELSYNATFTTYYAQVRARFFRADGKAIGELQGTGTYLGMTGSRLSEVSIQGAFDQAMRTIATQYAADASLQGGIDRGLARSPCALVALVPRL